MERERHEILNLVGLLGISLSALVLSTLAFTKKQRDSIVFDRDGGKCRATVKHECNEEDYPLELDHILTQRFLMMFGVDPDKPENALTKCRNAHDIKHPDRVKARKNYHKAKEMGGNSFLDLFNERNEKLKARQIYWNDANDRTDQVIAMKRTQEAEKEGWVFPPRKQSKSPIAKS